MEITKSILLLRGLPGSGKSTLANVLSEDGKYPVTSIDSYFTNPVTGEYAFEFQNNHLAYKQCEEKTIEYAKQKIKKIIVDNTFTLDWELEPYFKIAKNFGYTLFVMTVEKFHDGKNTHNVSDEQLIKMAEKYKVKLM